jgi:tRNA(fMet)-specific endonuclease VapC
MAVVVLDTSAYNSMRSGDKELTPALVDSEAVFLPAAMIAELKFGFSLGNKKDKNEAELSKIIESDKVSIAYPNDTTIDLYALVASYSRKKGVSLSNNDIWIAAHTLEYDAELVTYDKDFFHLDYPGLKIWNNKSK